MCLVGIVSEAVHDFVQLLHTVFLPQVVVGSCTLYSCASSSLRKSSFGVLAITSSIMRYCNSASVNSHLDPCVRTRVTKLSMDSSGLMVNRMSWSLWTRKLTLVAGNCSSKKTCTVWLDLSYHLLSGTSHTVSLSHHHQ